ncbi:MAG TPA: hypothetical protein GX728_06430 [Clostridiaceae bacterium]|nr:hypothetical protein [Clostridiaceae bacterium]
MDMNNSSEQSNQLQERRKRRSKRQRVALMAMSILVALTVVFTIWALVFIMARQHETTRLAFITKRTIEETVTCPVALIDPYEKLRAPAEGILVPLVEEGVRVAKGDRVALIVRHGLDDAVREYMSANEAYHARRIVLAGLSNSVEEALPKTRSESLMREAIFSLSRASTIGDLSGFQSAIRNMNRALDSYRGENLQETDGDDELTERKRERDRLLEQLEASAVTDGILTAPSPGTVSFYVSPSDNAIDEDGWREIADPKAEIERLASPSLLPIDRRQCHVTANMPIVCISNVAANTVIAVIPREPDDEKRLQRGDTVDLIISNEIRLDRCSVSRVVPSEEIDRVFLTVAADAELSTRLTAVADASMTVKALTGSAVPIRSLIDFSADMKTAKLKKVTKGVTKTIAVQVTAYDGTYAVIECPEGEEPLKEADLYVVNPWTIGEGQLID